MLENLKNALKNTVIYSVGNLSSKLLGLILIPLYTDKLTVSEYGILGILEITAQIFTAVFGMSLYNAFFPATESDFLATAWQVIRPVAGFY